MNKQHRGMVGQIGVGWTNAFPESSSSLLKSPEA